nr:MAG TPA: hypothetical protein [Caudoviricetes sp.]
MIKREIESILAREKYMANIALLIPVELIISIYISNITKR